MKNLKLIYLPIVFISAFAAGPGDYQGLSKPLEEKVTRIIKLYEENSYFQELFKGISKEEYQEIIQNEFYNSLKESTIQDGEVDGIGRLVKNFYGPDFLILEDFFSENGERSAELLSPSIALKYKLSVLKHYLFWKNIEKFIQDFKKTFEDNPNNCHLQQAYCEIIMEEIIVNHVHRLDFMKETMTDVSSNVCVIIEETLLMIENLVSYSKQNFSYFQDLLFEKINSKPKKKGGNSKVQTQKNKIQIEMQKLTESSSSIKSVQEGLSSIISSIREKLGELRPISFQLTINQFLINGQEKNINSHLHNMTSAFSIPKLLKEKINNELEQLNKLGKNSIDHFTPNNKILNLLDEEVIKDFMKKVLTNLIKKYVPIREDLEKIKSELSLSLSKLSELEDTLELFNKIEIKQSQKKDLLLAKDLLKQTKSEYETIFENYSSFIKKRLKETETLFQTFLKHWSLYANFNLLFPSNKFKEFFIKLDYKTIKEILGDDLNDETLKEISKSFFEIGENAENFLTQFSKLDILFEEDGIKKLAQKANFRSFKKKDLMNKINQEINLKLFVEELIKSEKKDVNNPSQKESKIILKMNQYKGQFNGENSCNLKKHLLFAGVKGYLDSFFMLFFNLDENKVRIEDIQNYSIKEDISNLKKLQGYFNPNEQGKVINFREIETELKILNLFKETIPVYSRGWNTSVSILMRDKYRELEDEVQKRAEMIANHSSKSGENEDHEAEDYSFVDI